MWKYRRRSALIACVADPARLHGLIRVCIGSTSGPKFPFFFSLVDGLSARTLLACAVKVRSVRFGINPICFGQAKHFFKIYAQYFMYTSKSRTPSSVKFPSGKTARSANNVSERERITILIRRTTTQIRFNSSQIFDVAS